MIAFKVCGTPVPQGSKKAVPLGGRFGGRPLLIDDNDKVLRPWRKEVARAAQANTAATGYPRQEASAACLVFAFKRPPSHFRADGVRLCAGAPRAHVYKPDVDKLARAVFDGLVEGRLIGDDSKITVIAHARKFYTRLEPFALVGLCALSRTEPWQQDLVERTYLGYGIDPDEHLVEVA